MIYVFNKCDQLDEQRKQDLSDQYYGEDCVFVSALTGEGLAELQDMMMKAL
jgi:50S ribosomal subunit-associated GTPase HflX